MRERERERTREKEEKGRKTREGGTIKNIYRNFLNEKELTYECPYVERYHDADDGGKEKPMYGVIHSIFTHCLYPGGPREVVLECEWLQTVLDQEQGNDVYLPQVRFNPDSNFNQRARLVLLRQCAAYNIMIAPHDPWDEQCTVYDVLDRWRTYEDHSLS